MQKYTNYLLVVLLSLLLIVAQSLWGSFIKVNKPLHGNFGQIVERFIASPKVWIGGLLYVLATVVYFLVLSKYKFFAVQIVMTAFGIIFSTSISYFLFQEKISSLNIVGMVVIMSGIVLVIK